MMKYSRFFLTLCICLFISFVYAQKKESSNWYVQGYTEDVAMKYFKQSILLDPIEGIWQSSDGFKYAIEKSVEEGRRITGKYRVVVLETSHDGWKLGQITGFISPGSVEKIYSFKYYTRYPNGTNTESQNLFLVVENPPSTLNDWPLAEAVRLSTLTFFPATSIKVGTMVHPTSLNQMLEGRVLPCTSNTPSAPLSKSPER